MNKLSDLQKAAVFPNRGLPVEVIELILQAVPRSSLPVALRTNSLFHAIALRVLYRSLTNLSPGAAISLLRSLARPSSSRRRSTPHSLVYTLTLDFSSHRLTGNLLRLIHNVLLTLPRLHSLSLEFGLHDNHFSLAWILLSVPFHLRSLTTSIRCDDQLASFLSSQPAIRELCLRGFQTTSPFHLPASALPVLSAFRVVHGGVPVLREIINGRPVEAVSLSLFTEDGYAPLDAVKLSGVPVKRLTVMSLDSTPPDLLLPAVATRLPELEALHIVVLLAQYNYKSLLASTSHLSPFSSLRYLTFMAGGLSSSLEDEGQVAQAWAKACPTLRTIILPKGKVWFRQDDGKWACYT